MIDPFTIVVTTLAVSLTVLGASMLSRRKVSEEEWRTKIICMKKESHELPDDQLKELGDMITENLAKRFIGKSTEEIEKTIEKKA